MARKGLTAELHGLNVLVHKYEFLTLHFLGKYTTLFSSDTPKLIKMEWAG
jgi:hypothetical protein